MNQITVTDFQKLCASVAAIRADLDTLAGRLMSHTHDRLVAEDVPAAATNYAETERRYEGIR